MAFIDEMKIYARAGKGGDGVERWLHERGKEYSGPAGGDGGNGGDVHIKAVRDVYILAKYKHNKKFMADDGESGRSSSEHGANGEDMIIDLPLGSIVKNLRTGLEYHLLQEEQKILILKGGRGGFGNEHFKSSTNTTPKEWTPGKEGEEAEFQVELQLFADLGLIGLPNAGKSSLLNALTKAHAKIGAYQFTTLDPNLGDFYGYIIADIPGLIEGASEGKGLGTKFLRHIKRTKILAHLVSFENASPNAEGGWENMMKVYKTIRKELEKHDPELSKKEEIILLTKTDVTDEKSIREVVKEFEKLKKPVFTVTLYDNQSIKNFGDELVKLLKSK